MTDNKQQITFYKLKHATDNTKDCYVGSTENYHARQINHKSMCNNPRLKIYNCHAYQYIRANGGFDNWTFDVLEQLSGLTKHQRLMRESELTVLHNATLNAVKAGALLDAGDMKEYNRRRADSTNTCDKCGGVYRNTRNKYLHQRTQKCQRIVQIRNQPNIIINDGSDIHIHIHNHA